MPGKCEREGEQCKLGEFPRWQKGKAKKLEWFRKKRGKWPRRGLLSRVKKRKSGTLVEGGPLFAGRRFAASGKRVIGKLKIRVKEKKKGNK